MQKERSILNTLPPNLVEVNSLFSENCNIKIKDYQIEKESSDYNAALFNLDKKQVIFRLAKITPKKIGMFVTLWKRNRKGITSPFHKGDNIDLVIVEVRKANQIGHFVFSQAILIEKGIITSNKEGKRGFRIYPPWELPSNNQAAASQLWQSHYFFERSKVNRDDSLRLKELINL
ncbi:MepB protein [Leptospira hartskeerlii]|uniref:MepB protein n=1 Tax=Leptospira hartskeerlii TaxID=2023177 RepID=A0A2M9XBE7_9LEPT|nr:MepB family protein [Leptospira hartskeerlii]PJZ24882.1 MepB protein [Leptospira hartskeerlii]PJZ33026.1 MepB protein [Leptospira hartskeerlii]